MQRPKANEPTPQIGIPGVLTALGDVRCRYFDDIVNPNDGLTSLREAVIQANQNQEPDTIILGPGVYRLGRTGTDNTAQKGDLDIAFDGTGNDVTIVGQGRTATTISNVDHGNDRAFHVLAAGARLSLHDLSIVAAAVVGAQPSMSIEAPCTSKCPSSRQSCLQMMAEQSTPTVAPGDSNLGSTTIVNSQLSHGKADSTGGGIVYNSDAHHRIIDSTINPQRSGPQRWSDRSLARRTSRSSAVCCMTTRQRSGYGGAITSGTDVSVIDSTLSGNKAISGGAIRSFGGSLQTRSSTIAFNEAKNHGRGISAKTPVDLKNTLISNNTDAKGRSVDAPKLTQSYSLIIADGRLRPLGDYGGPTKTHALMFDSPAVDAGHSFGRLLDQRGKNRTFDHPLYSETGDGTDIGAYELATGTQQLVVTHSGDSSSLDRADGLTLREVLVLASRFDGPAEITFATSVDSIKLNGSETGD